MSIALRSDSGGTSGAIQINGVDKLTIDSTGKVTATSFAGDGSLLTGITTLPTQTGNSGKFLTTNGTSASWAPITASVSDYVTGTLAVNTTYNIAIPSTSEVLAIYWECMAANCGYAIGDYFPFSHLGNDGARYPSCTITPGNVQVVIGGNACQFITKGTPNSPTVATMSAWRIRVQVIN